MQRQSGHIEEGIVAVSGMIPAYNNIDDKVAQERRIKIWVVIVTFVTCLRVVAGMHADGW